MKLLSDRILIDSSFVSFDLTWSIDHIAIFLILPSKTFNGNLVFSTVTGDGKLDISAVEFLFQ
jgi:hypothetical protein